ncbi:MAG: hypothetical protein M1839_002090 [Geoglossum umbratile]|nr:MAG: hypothetical protein M1839_002090 [Geoglossum umbratile]
MARRPRARPMKVCGRGGSAESVGGEDTVIQAREDEQTARGVVWILAILAARRRENGRTAHDRAKSDETASGSWPLSGRIFIAVIVVVRWGSGCVLLGLRVQVVRWEVGLGRDLAGGEEEQRSARSVGNEDSAPQFVEQWIQQRISDSGAGLKQHDAGPRGLRHLRDSVGHGPKAASPSYENAVRKDERTAPGTVVIIVADGGPDVSSSACGDPRRRTGRRVAHSDTSQQMVRWEVGLGKNLPDGEDAVLRARKDERTAPGTRSTFPTSLGSRGSRKQASSGESTATNVDMADPFRQGFRNPEPLPQETLTVEPEDAKGVQRWWGEVQKAVIPSQRYHLQVRGASPFTIFEVLDSRIITFKDRFTAEKFIYSGSDIPGIGKVDLSWVNTGLRPLPEPIGSICEGAGLPMQVEVYKENSPFSGDVGGQWLSGRDVTDTIRMGSSISPRSAHDHSATLGGGILLSKGKYVDHGFGRRQSSKVKVRAVAPSNEDTGHARAQIRKSLETHMAQPLATAKARWEIVELGGAVQLPSRNRSPRLPTSCWAGMVPGGQRIPSL